MATNGLSPNHLGEALVARLISAEVFGRLPVHDPRTPTKFSTVKDHLPDLADLSVTPNAPLDRVSGQPRFDGMHKLDCAVALADSVLAMELKLGDKGLTPQSFHDRFVADLPRLAHKGRSLGGNMVAFLDWNGRQAPAERPSVRLAVSSRPVRPGWLLMLREAVWESWARTPDLAATLGTSQMLGVVTFEELTSLAGADLAKSVALDLARESIESWFAASNARKAG